MEKQEKQPVLTLPTVTTLEGFHVTDDPANVLRVLQEGIPLAQGRAPGKVGDLQTSGLYFSEVPRLWVMSRSATLWKFAETLTREERERIGQAVEADRRMTGGEWYLTRSEQERVRQWVQSFIETGRVVPLQLLSEQPYNFGIWKASFLAPLGLTNPGIPQQVPVRASGRFADVSAEQLTPELIETLKQQGYDGGFVKQSLFTLQQAVVFHTTAIVQFGEWTPAAVHEKEQEKGPPPPPPRAATERHHHHHPRRQAVKKLPGKEQGRGREGESDSHPTI